MNSVFLTVRVLHVLGAALWLGSIVFISMFLMPVLQQSGPQAGAIMGALERRGLVTFMASISGLTVLSGIWLYWRFTGGFDATISGSTAGRVFGLGGVFGLLAAIIGGAVVGRSAKKANVLGARVTSAKEGPERAALVAQIQQLRQRVVRAGNLVVVLLVVTITLMALGHYL